MFAMEEKPKSGKQSIKIFGGLSFDINKESQFPWKDIPKSIFFVPKFLIFNYKNNIYLSTHIIINNNFNVNNTLNNS